MTSTKTVTGGSEETWTVPDQVETITIECWGAEGASGTESGGLGGYIKGELSVTPNETLTLVAGGAGGKNDTYKGGFPNGGDGGVEGRNGYYQGGGGGGSSHVMRGGTTQSDVKILAGGGGGGGLEMDGGNDSRGGHGNGGDAPDTEFLDGGVGGASDDWFGENGSSREDDDDNNYGCGGGGGGGYNGGGGGNANAGANDGGGTGGGGGDAYGGGVTNVTTEDAVQTGDGKIVITYEQPPEIPSDLNKTVGNTVDVNLTWTDNASTEDEYELYCDTTSPVDENSTLVATLPAGTESYTDTFEGDVDHYYAVRAVRDVYPSYFSNEIHVLVGTAKYYDGSSWTARTVYEGSGLEITDAVDVQ